MIDATSIEKYLRAANPIPSIDNIDADELVRSATAVDARRKTAMQAPTEERTQSLPTNPPQRWKRAWAFVVALILVFASIGIVTFLVAGGDGEVADELATSVPTTEALDLSARIPSEALVGDWTLVAWNPTHAGEDLDVAVLSGTLLVQEGGSVRWELLVADGGMTCNATIRLTGDVHARQSNAWDISALMFRDVQPLLCGGDWHNPGTYPFVMTYTPKDEPIFLELVNDFGHYTWKRTDS